MFVCVTKMRHGETKCDHDLPGIVKAQKGL